MPSFIKKSQLILLKIMQQGKTTAEVSNLLKKDFVVNFHCQADQTPIIDGPVLLNIFFMLAIL